MRINAKAWLIWVTAAAVISMVAKNPLYSLTLMLIALIMIQEFGKAEQGAKLPIGRIAILVILFSAIYTAVFVHDGSTTLFTLPNWPLIGGRYTVEALAAGASNGMALVALLAIFAALNAIVPVSELVRLIPGALHDIGIILLVAITYVPETRRQLTRIRQAQEIRGHQMKGIRDWQPVVVPLLVGGLERSMRLAETMVARGYGRTSNIDSSLAERLSLIIGLIAALGGWILSFWFAWPGWTLLGLGLLSILTVLHRRGQRNRRSRYKREKWNWPDVLLVVISTLSLALFVFPWPGLDQGSLSYSPFPQLHLPKFDIIYGTAILLLVMPVLTRSRAE